MWKRTICTVGAAQADDLRELIGPGAMAYVTSRTAIEPGTVLENGFKVLVDAERGEVRGRPALVVTRLRAFRASDEDIAAYEGLDRVLREVGLGAFALADVKSHVEQGFAHALRMGRAQAPDPLSDWIERVAQANRVYPMVDWSLDPEPAFEDMAELLALNGVEIRVEPSAIVAEFESRYDAGDDEDEVRAAVWSRIVDDTNAALAERGRPERWHRLPVGEPRWVLIDPTAWSALVAGGFIARAG